MSNASGLAASIRGSTESDTFDLGGQNVTTITNNIKSAFEEPFPIDEMIRITLVTGAGKLGRQKYDADAAKAVTAALRDLGFDEDRGASCVNECAGSFKLQHDTGKNLKTVVVFPNLASASASDAAAGSKGNNAPGSDGGESVLPKKSPEEFIAMSSKNVFENMVKSRCPAWSQKKGCIGAISSIKELLAEMDDKLLRGTPLSDSEQDFYDSVSASTLDEKLEHVKTLMHQQVDDGKITAKEKNQLLSQITERLETIQKELTEAQTEKKPKKVEKLTVMKEKATARKEKLTSISPSAPHKLKHEPEILKLRTELRPLLEMEEGAKGRLLSVKETQTLARKDEILEEIAELQEKSRGWFEDDESFALRVEASDAVWNAKLKQLQKKKSTAAAKKPASNPWTTTATSKPRYGKPKATAAAKKKPANRGPGGVFAAMMDDSDSD